MLALDLLWIGCLALLIDARRGQRRFGLGYVSLDALSLTLGGVLTLHVGSERGLGGLKGLGVELRCVDAVFEERETTIQESRTTEEQRVCYVVWADEQRIESATGRSR